MINYLRLIGNPQIRHEPFLRVLCDFRKGGLNLDVWDEFINSVKKFERNECNIDIFQKFNLSDISWQDFIAVLLELKKRSISEYKRCWHPNAGPKTCEVDDRGRIIISSAHSIQNNGVLNKIAENGHVVTFDYKEELLTRSKPIGKKHASIFWGFCNKHDAIFNPIDSERYEGREIQNFLFSYRAFVVSAHIKIETGLVMNHGNQSDIDIQKNKQIFDHSILRENYSKIVTHRFELPSFYPVAYSGCFYLEYDFNGNEIAHSKDRMEFIFLTVFPTEENKTNILISYFKEDEHLYGELTKQIQERCNLKYDISILIAAFCENVYFSPSYYQAFIAGIEPIILDVFKITHFDIALLGNNNQIVFSKSVTPEKYLTNPWNINLFKN